MRAKFDGVCSTDITVIRAREPIDTGFLFYFIASQFFIDYATATSSGTRMPRAKWSILSQRDWEIPEQEKRAKIAAVLSAYDDLIENNTRRINILEEMAQTIYREWFVEFRFPGHEGVEMVESELGLIPQGWEVGKLGDSIENIKEKVKPGKHLEPMPYVPIDCIPRRSMALTEHKPSSEAKSSLIAFKRNDILFGAMRSYFHKVIFAPFDGITRQTCFVLRSKNSDNYPFDLFTMFQDSTVEYSSNHSTGSTIPYATWDGALSRMSIVKPSNPLIEQFGSIVRPMLDSMRVFMMKNINLRQTRDLLLPKLIAGEIDVAKLDIRIDGMQPRKGGAHIPSALADLLHSDEGILGGKPVIRGTRLAVNLILELLAHEWSEERIIQNYPTILPAHIAACLAYQQEVTDASVSR